MEWDDEDLARQVDDALTGGGCDHPAATLQLDEFGLRCGTCGTGWAAATPDDLLGVMLDVQRVTHERVEARLARLEDTLARRLGVVACAGCGQFLTRIEGVRLAVSVRACPEHVAAVVWQDPDPYLHATVAWVLDSGLSADPDLGARACFEHLLANVPAVRDLLGAAAELRDDPVRLPVRVAARLGVPADVSYSQVVAATAALFDVAAPGTRTGAAQLLGVVAAAATERRQSTAGGEDSDARWARLASQAWLPNPTAREVAFCDLYREVLDPDEPADRGFVDDALAVLTQRGAELLLTPRR